MAFKHIEFDKIIEILQIECHSVLGRMQMGKLTPIKDRSKIEYRLQLASEAQELLAKGYHFNFEDITDLWSLLFKFKHDNYNHAEFTQIYRNIYVANSIQLDASFAEDFPELYKIISKITTLEALQKRYEQIFDSEGNVQDGASSKLMQVRRRKRRVRKDIVSFLSKRADELHGEKKSYDSIVTSRDGRYMIPVKEGSATFIKGILHGRSSSKASVYLEPQEVVQQNNELDILFSDEKQEIKRIFISFTEDIKANKESINENSKILEKLDYYFAVGRFSNRINAKVPQICEELIIKLDEARHPLLIESYGDLKKVIPFSLELGNEYNLLVISGPNTGGKTVTLKSVGLLSIMALSGLPIPASADSKIGLFTSFYADIGDHQSLEDSLSTFSSHIKNINEMIISGDEKSLILIDEIGAATDPEQGSALAQAILEKLSEQGSSGVITTHYTALKIFAERNENCINASMQFDTELHTPTYNFKLGLPGNSFAIEVAANLGFDEKLIERARELSGDQNIELTELLVKMSEEKKKLARENYKFELNNALLKQKIVEHQRKVDEIERSKKDVRKRSIKDARDYLTQLQKELNAEISHIKKGEKSQQKTNLSRSLQKVNNLNIEYGKKAFEMEDNLQKPIENPQIGEKVWIKNFDAEGVIVQIMAKSAKIDMDGIFFSVDLKNIYHPQNKSKEKKIYHSSNVPSKQLRTEIKILGLIFEEARLIVDEFIDDAVINGLDIVRIVHGKGTGALRRKVRQHLRKNKKISSFHTPAPEAGGDGVTVVVLKK